MKNSVLAIITARAGSKGIPGKNKKMLGGKPLLSWTIESAKASKLIDRLIISTEDTDIQTLAERYGCEVPFTRPAELATDEAGSVDVIVHALESIKEKYENFILLQPTSPFRTNYDIDNFLKFSVDINANLVVSVNKLKKHPMFMYEIRDGFLKPFIQNGGQLRRQDMPAAYEHNGAMYFSKVSYFLEKRSFNTPDAIPFVTEGSINIDIDTPDDWSYAEYLIETGNI